MQLRDTNRFFCLKTPRTAASVSLFFSLDLGPSKAPKPNSEIHSHPSWDIVNTHPSWDMMHTHPSKQCSGSGSSRISIIWSDPHPDPYQKALIWIRVAPKDYSGKKSIFFKIFNFFVPFRPVLEYIINIVYKL